MAVIPATSASNGQMFGDAGHFTSPIFRVRPACSLPGSLAAAAAFLGSIPVISAWNISMPAAQSMMTHRVSEREQGETAGALQSMRSITFIIGPVLFSQTFSWFIDPKHSVHMPGAPFYLAALLLFTAMSCRRGSDNRNEHERGQRVEYHSDVVPTSGVIPPEL